MNKVIKSRKCVVCGKDYTPVRVWQKYCSHGCSQDVNQIRQKKYVKEHYQKNREKYREAGKRWIEKNRATRNYIVKALRWMAEGKVSRRKRKSASYWKEYRKQWLEKNKEKVYRRQRSNELKKSFGITIEQYDEMFKSQNGCCAICKTHRSALPISLAVDHCHISNKIRGLLCRRCNQGVGLFNDDHELMFCAAQYIQSNKSSYAPPVNT